jgi:hypothetical protein
MDSLAQIGFNRELHVFRSPDIFKVVGDAVDFLLKSPVHKLPLGIQCEGAGVYAIYYKGDFEHYKKLAALNKVTCQRPIYVGKAVPPGWRQTRQSETVASSLCNRLREHGRGIESVKNLSVENFTCRFMILEGQESNLISTIESELIRRFIPLWNSVIDGFGNHDPGSGRYNQSPSEWDILHPGRIWAQRLTGKPPSRKNAISKIHHAIDSL